MKNNLAAVVVLSGLILGGEALLVQNSAAQGAPPAATSGSPSSIDQQIAGNMKLTDAEAERFWPTYDQYVNELVKINDTKYALIKEYLQSTNLTDEQVDSMSKK